MGGKERERGIGVSFEHSREGKRRKREIEGRERWTKRKKIGGKESGKKTTQQ